MSGVLETAPMLEALDRLRGTGSEFHGFLANHGPMAADAMIRLGGADRVGQWLDLYRVNLDPASPRGDRVGVENWKQYLGDAGAEGDWISFFRTAAARDGWRELLAVWLPRLLPGAAAGASHGLLRTAHAVRNLADGLDREPLALDEFAAGLAFWASRYQRLPGSPDLSGSADLATAIADLPRLDPNTRSRGPGISGRLMALFDLPGLPVALDGWGPEGDETAALDELIGYAARTLLARADSPIVYCHAVTAPAAVRMILPDIPAEQHRPALAGCWQLVAGLLAAFAQRPDPPIATPLEATPDRAHLARAAIEHGDEHVIKLTEACIRQFDLTGDHALLAAADGFRQRMHPFW